MLIAYYTIGADLIFSISAKERVVENPIWVHTAHCITPELIDFTNPHMPENEHFLNMM